MGSKNHVKMYNETRGLVNTTVISHKYTMRRLFILLIILPLFGCVASERRDWSFMQSVGGLTVAGQDKNPNWLILRGDISGLKKFSTKPTQVNSALALKSVEAKIHDSKIQIYVVTTLISERYSTTEISGVNISGAKKGTYMIQYLNPDNSTVDLKKVVIN